MTAVSVIIPAYNSAKTLRACLASAYAQSHPPAEVIVVDDASTDGTAAIAAEFVAQFGCHLIRLDTNGGVSAARNAGAAASTGEVLFFLDSDGALVPDAVAAAVAELRAHPECGCVAGVYDPMPMIDDGPIERYRTLHTHWGMSRIAGETQTACFGMTAVTRAAYDAVGPPLGLVWTPLWPAPLLFFALFALANPQLSVFVRRSRGTGFLLFFTAVHLLVNLALAAGLAWGMTRALAGADFGPGRTRRDHVPVLNPNRIERQAP